MIILDTCTLRACGFGNDTDLLAALRKTDAHRVAVPWMVLEELAAQKAVAYDEKFEKALAAAKALQAASPWADPHGHPAQRTEEVRQHWRDVYRRIVDVIPTSDAALREGLVREANVLPPCGKKKEVKTGARDAAIWLSAVEYAREHPEETVYFVSGNSGDFGDGETYPDLMARDIEGLGDRFVHLTKLDDVFALFTKPTEVDEEQVRYSLCSTMGVRHMELEAGEPGRFEGYAGLLEDGRLGRIGIVIAMPQIALRSLDDIDAYRVGNDVWCTATARWFVLLITDAAAALGVLWTARVLVTLTADEPRVSLLRTIDVTPAEEGDLAAIARANNIWRGGRADGPRWLTKAEALLTLPEDALARYRSWKPQRIPMPRSGEDAW